MAAERPRLVLMTADTVGGVWHYAIELACGLSSRGVDVALATMGAPLSASQRAQVARVGNVTVHESTYRLEWMSEARDDVRRAGAWLLDLERELGPDIVHLNQFAFGALPFSAPTLVVAHSCVLSWWRAVNGRHAPDDWSWYSEAVRSGLERASLVAAPTAAMLATLRENYGYSREGRVISNGRDAAQYAPSLKEPVIFAAGRLWDPAKNLAALEAVAPHLPWPVHVAGSTAQPGGGVREVRGIRALGELAPDELATHFARAAIYALPARYEPFGLSVLEAALAGCALVIGDIPSLREVWGSSALYVAPDDHAALRECLMGLVADPRLRAQLAEAARSRALHFTPERMTDGYIGAYRALLDCGEDVPERTITSTVEPHACAS